MAYIQPNTTINLLREVPLDRNYENTYYFDNALQQYNYFITKIKPNIGTISFVLEEYTYQRHTKNSIKVGIECDRLTDINYMMFQNITYGGKWFYAFIDSVEYVNDGCSIINYTIDEMQTWMFDYELGECFVEREHSDKDVAGDNTVPENIETGESTVQYTREKLFTKWTLVIYYIPNEKVLTDAYWSDNTGLSPSVVPTSLEKFPDESTNPDPIYRTSSVGKYVDKLFTPLSEYAIDIQDYQPTHTGTGYADDNPLNAITSAILAIPLIGGTIVSVQQIPTEIYRNRQDVSLSIPRPTSIISHNYEHNYNPKNKKLFTYPYVQCVVTNHSGEAKTFKFEDFKNSVNATFSITSTAYPDIKTVCFPTNYKNMTNFVDTTVTVGDYPDVPWSTDSFSVWLQQNKANIAMAGIKSAINLIAGLYSGGIAATAGVVSTANNVANILGNALTAERTPDSLQGNSEQNAFKAKKDLYGITAYAMGVKVEYAKIIDNYFTMFGYATNRLKEPNRKVRESFTYTKTRYCIIHGKIPADTEEILTDCYNKGITFWNPNVEIGNYSASNRPLSEVTENE